MNEKLMDRELQEAIQAGERALGSLQAAREKLNSAKNWGIFDMLGGGFWSSLIKHSKMEDAVRDLENANYDLKVFQREVKDVQVSLEVKMDVENFLTFADYFFDGFVADYLVQSRIEETREKVDGAIVLVKSVLGELKSRR